MYLLLCSIFEYIVNNQNIDKKKPPQSYLKVCNTAIPPIQNQAKSEEWGTPLHLAAFRANRCLVKMLLDAGEDRTSVSTGWRYPGLTPEQLVLARNSQGDLSEKWDPIIRLLSS